MRRGARRAAAPAALLLTLAASQVSAQDTDGALASFSRPAAAAERGAPVTAPEWERRLRTAERLGPVPLRVADLALLEAARAGRWAECLKLAKEGRASTTPRDEAQGHVLVLAARAGQDDLLRTLLRQGAEIDRRGEDGLTALGAAALAGQRSTVRLLLRAGADPRLGGAGGQTALHLASVSGRTDMVDEMLRGGVPVDLLNRHRETALDVAANAGQIEVMDRLLKAGADTTQAGQR